MRKAFTLIELLIYVAIFSVVIVAFITIFVSIIQIQSKQSASGEVESQSQFLLQQVQYYVEEASLIDMPQDTATTTLTLRMANPNADPTYITLASGTIYLQQGATGTPEALSSNQVAISNLSFTKHSNPPGHDSVSVAMTVSYNTSNIEQMFSQAFQTSIARVSAATFDSNLIPSTTAYWNVGVAGNVWNSINQILYFSGSNVGIDTTSSNPQQALEVNGGIRLNTAASQPGCSAASSTEGTLWFTNNGGSASDTLQLCVRGAGGYQWVRLY